MSVKACEHILQDFLESSSCLWNMSSMLPSLEAFGAQETYDAGIPSVSGGMLEASNVSVI